MNFRFTNLNVDSICAFGYREDFPMGGISSLIIHLTEPFQGSTKLVMFVSHEEARKIYRELEQLEQFNSNTNN